MLQLVSDRDDALALTQTDPEKTRQRRHDLDRILLLLVLDHPHDDIKRIVEKMRVNLGLQGIKLAPALRFVFRHDIFHQCLDALCHIADGTTQMPDLIRASHIHFRIQIPRLDRIDRPLQLLNRGGDAGGDKVVGEHQHQQKGRHHKDRKELHFQIAQGQSLFRRHAQQLPSRIAH